MKAYAKSYLAGLCRPRTAIYLCSMIALAVAVAAGLIPHEFAGVPVLIGMAAPADYWDSADLKALNAGGLVNEDVMQKIFNISRIPLPFTDAIESSPVNNDYTEWTQDAQAAVDTANANVSGADASGNQSAGGSRVGNHCQNSDKVVEVTERSRSVNVIGRADEFSYQLMMRNQDIRRDVEAIALSNQASVADDNNTTAGKAGAFPAWLATVTNHGVTGAAGGFVNSTKLVAAVTPGNARALTWANLTARIQASYLQNGNPTKLMSVAELIAKINQFILGAPTSARVATPTANVKGEGGGVDQTAQGYVNVLVTDFGTTLELVPNRIQQRYTSADSDTVAALLGIDVEMVALGFLKGYQTKPLAKLGTSDRAQISADWTVKVYQEKAHFGIFDLDPDAAVTAT